MQTLANLIDKDICQLWILIILDNEKKSTVDS